MKLFFSIAGTLILFYFFGCTKTSDTSISEKLLTVKPWILQYTDSLFIDSNSVAYTYRISSKACTLQESLIFLSSHIYQQKLVCYQPAPKLLTGQWEINQDSLLSFGLIFDSLLKPSTIREITQDSLLLIQFHSFDSTVYHRPIYFTDAYSH
jgi:hypothetical protein